MKRRNEKEWIVISLPFCRLMLRRFAVKTKRGLALDDANFKSCRKCDVVNGTVLEMNLNYKPWTWGILKKR